ncbi:MAG: PAS domain S-box protein, partial [Candidatus Pacebacteria bacterium]|nr:PAS domain S-box protein [Candidatus Paceibacterota bacterium]
IFIGSFITLTIDLVLFLFLQSLFEIDLILAQLASYSMVFMVGFTGYAIIRHQFFNIRLIIFRSIAFMLFVGIVSLLYTGVFIVSVTSILGKIVENDVIFINIILGLIVTLSFYPLLKQVMKVTDKIFYKSRYNIKEVLSKISDVALETIDLDVSYDKVLTILTEEMKISWATCMSVDNGNITQTRVVGKTEQNLAEVKDELEKTIKNSSKKQYFYNDLPEGETKKFFHRFGIVLFAPVYLEDKLVSVLLLGEKGSGEMYMKEDAGVFEVTVLNLGSIIQKTRAYERIKKYNVELEVSKEHIEKLIENLTVGIVEYDDRFAILRVNSTAEKTLGVKRKDILGKMILPKDVQKTDLSSLACVLYPSLSEKTKHLFSDDAITGIQHNELIIKHPLERELEVTTFSIKEDESEKRTRFVKMIRDITREKAIDRNKSEFISVAAHQLRTPLSGIRWATQLLLETATSKLSDEESTMLNDIARADNNLIRVVNDLLNVARVEERSEWIEKKEYSIVELVQELFCTNEMAAKNKKLRFEFKNEAPDIKPLVFDRQSVSIALQSVINNAIDYTEKGKIIITLKEQQDNVLIEVSDTGIGISEEGKENLFTKFHRTEESKKVETDRSGLGLYLTKQIIEKHGGMVHIRSKQGKGTTVGILLPK